MLQDLKQIQQQENQNCAMETRDHLEKWGKSCKVVRAGKINLLIFCLLKEWTLN
jgi:hypothetical protein